MHNVRFYIALVAILGADLEPRSLGAQSGGGDTHGVELAAAVNLLDKQVKLDGNFFLPRTVGRVRAVIVVINYGLGSRAIYHDPEWQRLSGTLDLGLFQVRVSNVATDSTAAVWNDAALGGAEGLLMLLERLARESKHPELKDAPLIFWGHSGAGPFGSTFAQLHPQRTIAFVRYHSGARPLDPDLTVLSGIPALFFVGGKDTVGNPETAQTLFRKGRATRAPWTFAVEPNATHGSVEDLKEANSLLIPWITAVLRQRVSPEGARLRVVSGTSGWVGNSRTLEVASSWSLSGSNAEVSWLPDEASAERWRTLRETVKN